MPFGAQQTVKRPICLPTAAANVLAWILLRRGMLDTELSEGDHVVFISTLHGG